MAPVIDNTVRLDAAAALVRQTFVLVEAFETRASPLRYKNCNGFILDARVGRIYVAVRTGKFRRSAFLGVRFNNNAIYDATIHDSYLGFHILEVVAEGNFEPVQGNFQQVEDVDLETVRTDVIILSQSKMEVDLDFDAYSSSVIVPENEVRLFPGGRREYFHHPSYFTIGFSANKKIEDIVGAPVFDLHGGFLGTIDSSLPDYDDIVYVRWAWAFVPQLIERI